MVPCLNGSVPGWLPLREMVSLAQKTGYPCVEIPMEEAVGIADKEGEGALQAIFQDSGVKPAVFGLQVNWREDTERFEESLDRLPRQAELAAKLGCQRTATWVLPYAINDPVDAYAERIGKRFKKIARILGTHSISLGLEFIGPHHFMREGEIFARTMDQMLDFIQSLIDEPNVGLLVDSYHWYTTESTPEALARLKPEQIVYVHVNDAKPLPIPELMDGDRLLHGEGVIDLVGFLRALKQAGYTGPVAPEPLGRNLAKEMGIEQALRHSREQLELLFEKAGV